MRRLGPPDVGLFSAPAGAHGTAIADLPSVVTSAAAGSGPAAIRGWVVVVVGRPVVVVGRRVVVVEGRVVVEDGAMAVVARGAEPSTGRRVVGAVVDVDSIGVFGS
jgi:hypothetical protein